MGVVTVWGSYNVGEVMVWGKSWCGRSSGVGEVVVWVTCSVWRLQFRRVAVRGGQNGDGCNGGDLQCEKNDEWNRTFAFICRKS